MLINIELNEKLVKEAFHYSSANTEQELIEFALMEYIQNHRRRDVSELKGKIKISDKYDYKKHRSEKNED